MDRDRRAKRDMIALSVLSFGDGRDVRVGAAAPVVFYGPDVAGSVLAGGTEHWMLMHVVNAIPCGAAAGDERHNLSLCPEVVWIGQRARDLDGRAVADRARVIGVVLHGACGSDLPDRAKRDTIT